MKYSHSLLLTISIGLLCLLSCQRDVEGSLPGANNSIVPTPVTASLTGLIIDENGQPFPGVTVKAGTGNMATTDAKGQFRFKNITLDKYTSLVTAEIAGYFKGYRVFAASNKGTNFIKLQLIKRNAAGSISATAGGSASVGGYTITLPANGVVVKSTGAAYTGAVTIFAQPIDPTQQNISDILPGSFAGRDSTGELRLIRSFGMIAVELHGAAGELLQIATGKKAGIDFAIPATMLAQAPASIPLWYVDEQTGIWKQEGRAVKTGNTYKGEVSHFSFWNCDLIIDGRGVYVSLIVKDMAGRPVPYTKARISKDLTGEGAYGFTDSTGYVGGVVPKNEPLTLTLLDNCNEVVYTKPLGALTQHTDLGTLSVSFTTHEVKIGGTVKDCNGVLVTNGWVYINLNNISYNLPLDNNGKFGVTLVSCTNATLTVIANDITNTQSGNPKYYTVHVDPTDNLSLVACGNQLDIYMVSTFAGNGDQVYLDGTGTAASFFAPQDICIDATGNFYVADGNMIRKITPAGVVTSFVGHENPGFVNGTGTAARFESISGVEIDASGNLFVTDGKNHCIRKVTPAGVVSTIAGDGTRGFGGFADGTGTAALFDFPSGLGLDNAGNIYVADANNNRVRKVTPAGVVTTVAGSTEGFLDGPVATAKFNDPADVVVDASGNLIIADNQNSRIRKIATDGTVTTIAGNGTSGSTDGPALVASFFGINSVGLDASGNIIVCEHAKIRKIANGTVSTLAGGNAGYEDGLGDVAKFSGTFGPAIAPNRTMYVTDVLNRRIRKLTPQ